MSIAAQIEMSKNRTSLQNRHSPIAEGHNVRNDDLRHAHNATAPDAGDPPEDDKLDDCAREPRCERADHEYAHREAERELSAEDVAKAPICEKQEWSWKSVSSQKQIYTWAWCVSKRYLWGSESGLPWAMGLHEKKAGHATTTHPTYGREQVTGTHKPAGTRSR